MMGGNPFERPWTSDEGLDLLDRCMNPLVEELTRIVIELDVHSFNQIVTCLDYVLSIARENLEKDLERMVMH